MDLNTLNNLSSLWSEVLLGRINAFDFCVLCGKVGQFLLPANLSLMFVDLRSDEVRAKHRKSVLCMIFLFSSLPSCCFSALQSPFIDEMFFER